MKFFVYHANRDNIIRALDRDFYLDEITTDPKPAIIKQIFTKRGFYNRVAEVEADNLDQVFELTNHISHPWPENEGVKALADKVRSTSVGDVILSSDGPAHIVAAMGFEQLG